MNPFHYFPDNIPSSGTSFESRNAVNYHKFSLKIDSLMVEGCNRDNDLVTVLKLTEETHGRGGLKYFAVVVFE